MSSQRAVRLSQDGTHVDVVEFVGAPGEQILTTTHLPVETPRVGLVVCSSLRAEFETNYRREILLGRTLAAKGIAVHRFQYRGTGNSDGDTATVTLQTMLADARRATETFIQTSGVKHVAFMGTRLGGTIAATVASEKAAETAAIAASPVVLWEPVVDAPRYYRQIFRARKMWAVGGSDEIQTETAMQEFERTGSIDIVGYPIDRNLYDSVVGHELGDIDLGAHPTLIVQMGGRHGVKRDYAALADKWDDVACEVVAEDESWWLEHPGERQEKRTMNSSPAIDVTVDWIEQWARSAEVAA